jgi:hypothetical protein
MYALHIPPTQRIFLDLIVCVTILWRVHIMRTRGSSVSIVSVYGLNDRVIEVPFPGGKARPGRDADTHPHLMLRSWISRIYISFPPCASIGVLWDGSTFLHIIKLYTIYFFIFLLLSLSCAQNCSQLRVLKHFALYWETCFQTHVTQYI